MLGRIYILIIMFCILLLSVGCNNTANNKQLNEGTKIYSWSSSLGSVDENTLDKTKLSYVVNLTNENQDTVFIKSYRPLISKDLIALVLSDDNEMDVNRNIGPKETIQLEGEIILDTKNMSKADIHSLEPFITDIKITKEEVISLK